MNKLLLFIIVSTALFTSCSQKKGCMDPAAKNYNIDAGADCCCEYEKIVFFSRYQGYYAAGVAYPLTAYPVKLYIDNAEAGTISAFYPGGPGNSTVPGVVVYSPTKRNVEWYAKVTFPNGSYLILGSGTIVAGKQTWYQPIF